MNTILALVTCIAMLISGATALPAQPETAEVLTIDNITVWDDNEVVTLNPSVELTAQLGSEKSDFRFEIKDTSGESRLPVSASLDTDGITLDLGGENVYHISAATIDESLGELDSESAVALLGSAADLIAVTEDPEAYAELGEQIMTVITGHYTDKFTETQVEVNDRTLDGVEGDIDIFSPDMFTVLDELAEMDNAYGEYCKAMLELFNATSGTSYESFSQMYTGDIADIAEGESAPVHIVLAGDDSAGYLAANLSCADAESEEAVDCNMVCTVDGDDIEMSMEMTMTEDDSTADCSVSVSRTDTIESLSMEYNSNSEYSWESLDENNESVSYTYTNDASVIAGYSKVIVDENTSNEEFTVTLDSVGNAGQADESTQHYELRGERSVSPEDNGSLAQQTYSLTMNDETVGLSYDAHRSEAGTQDFIAGKTVIELDTIGEITGDEGAEGEDTEGESTTDMMQADITAMSGDLIALASDESVQELVALFADIDPYDSEAADTDAGDDEFDDILHEDTDETDDDDYDDEYDYDDGMTQVETLEEAAAIYTGDMPAYTAPEGYSVESIDVDETTLYVQYTAEDMPDFQLAAYAYDAGMEVYTYKDGAFTPLDGQVVQISPYDDGNVYSANVMNAQGNVIYFYFYDDATMDQATAVLSGLE